MASNGDKKWKLSYVNGKVKVDTVINPNPESKVEETKVIIKPSAVVKDILRLLDNWKDDD